MFEKLFSPIKIKDMELKNRIILPAMGTKFSGDGSEVTDKLIDYHVARVKGGSGLNIVEVTSVYTPAAPKRFLSLSEDEYIPGMKRLTDAIHAEGGKAGVQLWLGALAVSSDRAAQIIIPSDMPISAEITIPGMPKELIPVVVDAYGKAANRAVQAGYDCIEFHCAHTYLPHSFLSGGINRRTDEYGGSFENRLRMITEIIEGIRAQCGPDFPIGVRLSVEEFLDKTGVTEDYIHIQDGVKIAMALEKCGIDFIDVSVGLYETGNVCVEPISFPQGWRKDLIKAVKDHVSIPVIGVSCIREPQIAEQFLEGSIVDFVSMGRSWLADEEWGRKVLERRENELCKCINCLRCFESLNAWMGAGIPAECAVNPRACRERRYGNAEYDSKGHKAVVVGGGPSGMIAAKTLAERGVKVTLIDRQNELGGTVNLAKKPPLKERMSWIADYYKVEFEKLGVKVKLGVEATAESIAAMNPDAVLVASGSKSIIPRSIPGIDGEHVYTVEEILTGKAGLKGKKALIVGAGVTGLETAEYLCHEGNTVVLADMLEKVAPNANHTNVADVCGRLKKYNAQFMLAHALKEIKENGVVLERLSDHELVTVDADAVVLSLGFRPDNGLVEELKEKGIPAQAIGNAVKDGTIAPASRSGFEAARALFKTSVRTPSFITAPDDMPNFGKISLMKNQEGVYLAYLTDPAAIARILPPPLKPFSVPVVTVSVCHVKEPTFADDYYEAILGVYCTYGKQLGLYPIGLVLGGPGAEMAVQCGRDNGSIPKKLGSEFVIRRNGEHITAQVCRRGTELVNIDLEVGEYNNAMTGMLYQFPEAGKKTYGGGFYFHLDREPDTEGKSHFQNGALLQNLCEYNYHSWEPGFASVELKSSIDDPWGELPIRTVIGGAYSSNDLMVHKLNLCEEIDADILAPYLLTARYDRTAFMETGRR